MGFARCRAPICNLIAGGLALFLESDVPQGATMMSAFAPSSFAGLTSSLLVWLLSGGTLALHHPFDGDVLEQQINDDRCDTLVAPAQLALRLAEIDMPARLPSIAQCDRSLARAGTGCVEPALDGPAHEPDRRLSVRRGRVVRRLPRRRWRAGADPARTPRRAARRRRLVDRGRDPDHAKGNAGTARPDGRDRGLRAPLQHRTSSLVAQPPRDYVDTDYAARLDRSTGAICITAPPAGIMAVGGYRFLSQDLQEWAKRLGQGALLTALPDRLSGYRLAGRAQDNARAREALAELGLNPLMVEAFRDRVS